MGIQFLVACNDEDITKDKPTSKDPVSTEQVDNQEEKDDLVEEEEEAEETKPATNLISGVEAILKETAEGLKNIHGMKVTGEITSTIEMVGVTSKETTQVTGEISLSPYTQHSIMHTVSDNDPPSESELYSTEEAIYMPHPEGVGWISMLYEETLNNTEMFLLEPQLAHFSKYHEKFELSENELHYTITFTGSDDVYKEVFWGNRVDSERLQRLKDSIKSISGTHQFTIDKNTFHIIAAQIDIEQKTENMGIEVHSIEQMSYTYSDFNEIDRVVVPPDVIENAQVISIPL